MFDRSDNHLVMLNTRVVSLRTMQSGNIEVGSRGKPLLTEAGDSSLSMLLVGVESRGLEGGPTFVGELADRSVFSELGLEGFFEALSSGHGAGKDHGTGLTHLYEGLQLSTFNGGTVEACYAGQSLLHVLELDVAPLRTVQVQLEVRGENLPVLGGEFLESLGCKVIIPYLEGVGFIEVVDGDVGFFVVGEVAVLHGDLDLGVEYGLAVHRLLGLAGWVIILGLTMVGVLEGHKSETSTFVGEVVLHDLDCLDGSED